MLIEIIATNINEAIQIEKFGGGRVELIDSFSDGGLSPNLKLSKAVADAVSIPVNVMVRPHARNFCYDHNDWRIIESEIDYLLSNTKINGVVFGVLDDKGKIDTKGLERMIRLVDGKGEITFHRAIDESIDPVLAFKELQNYGRAISNVLSSGGMPTAIEGRFNLRKMQDIKLADGAKLLPGSGVNPSNALDLVSYLNVEQLHIGTGVRKDNLLHEVLFRSLLQVV